MEKETNNLDSLKGKNPFLVPDGYMEGLTSQIMSQLPEKKHQASKSVNLWERMRPWVYMAAMFAGLGLFFKLFVAPKDADNAGTNAQPVVQTDTSGTTLAALKAEEDADFLEYLETQYTSYILAEEIGYYE